MLRINRLAKCAARFSSSSPRPMPWQMDNLLDIGSREIFTEEHDAERERFLSFYVLGKKVFSNFCYFIPIN